jgi:hypothetical protein
MARSKIALGLLLVSAIPASLWWATSGASPAAAAGPVPAWDAFEYYHEFFGPNAYSNPQIAQNFRLGMMNGLGFTPPVVSGVARAAQPYDASLLLRLPGAPGPAGISGEAIEAQRIALDELTAGTTDTKRLWNLLPEWDQSGGAWVAQGRPLYDGLTRAAAHARFLDYYRKSFPGLMTYLQSPPQSRGYLLTAVTDYSPNVFDAYELGAEVQMLERCVDELGDIFTGLAYIRGAGNQYGRPWGVDISTWRTSNGRATNYATNGALQGGWSAGYLRRHTYAAFLGGANLILNEASIYRYPDGRLNPFGEATQEFADFALRRHPELGHAAVTTALLVDPHSGFDPKHGIYNQGDSVWYRDLPYSGGDTMMNQFFRLAYPNHWWHGLTPGAPFANSAGVPNTAQFQAFLAAGRDPRPYEPMPFTRWGDQFDVIGANVDARALRKYRMVILLGDVTLDARSREVLSNWVSAGGTLLMNAAQATPADQELAGVSFDGSAARTSRFSRWSPDDEGRSEALYSYTVVRPRTAAVWAMNDAGDPLITSNPVGDGQVVFTTPAYLEPVNRNAILAIGVQLFDWLFDQRSIARVAGPPISYTVNTAPGKIVVALFNPTALDWTGEVSTSLPDRKTPPDRVAEYVSEQSLPFSAGGGSVTVPVEVPAFDLKVIAFEFPSQSSQELSKPGKIHAIRPYQKQ